MSRATRKVLTLKEARVLIAKLSEQITLAHCKIAELEELLREADIARVSERHGYQRKPGS